MKKTKPPTETFEEKMRNALSLLFPTAPENTEIVLKQIDELYEGKLHSLKDRASLFDSIVEAPTFITFYTGQDGQGGALKKGYVSKRHHHDGILEREANKIARKLGACSYVQFKVIGVPVNVYYGRYGEESRLDFLEVAG